MSRIASIQSGWADIHDSELAGNVREWARQRFRGDRNAAHQETSVEDSVSPTLTEAQLMAMCLRPEEFEGWFSRFIPELPANLLRSVTVPDRSDRRMGQLDGLNLSRAWGRRSLPPYLPWPTEEAAAFHLEIALPHVAENYMGEHWLATLALLALSSETDQKT